MLEFSQLRLQIFTINVLFYVIFPNFFRREACLPALFERALKSFESSLLLKPTTNVERKIEDAFMRLFVQIADGRRQKTFIASRAFEDSIVSRFSVLVEVRQGSEYFLAAFDRCLEWMSFQMKSQRKFVGKMLAAFLASVFSRANHESCWMFGRNAFGKYRLNDELRIWWSSRRLHNFRCWFWNDFRIFDNSCWRIRGFFLFWLQVFGDIQCLQLSARETTVKLNNFHIRIGFLNGNCRFGLQRVNFWLFFEMFLNPFFLDWLVFSWPEPFIDELL